MKKKKQRRLQWQGIAWLLITTGIIIVTLFIYFTFTNKLNWFGGELNIEHSGQVGSFIGGTAGALWALAGVFFFMSALSMQSEELEEQGRANSSALAWSIFSQNLEALEKLQASQEYQKEVTNIINNVLYDLPLAVGCGAISQKHSSKRALENFEIQDDNTNDLNQFRIDLDIAIHNTDKNKYVFKFLRYMDTFSKTLEKYADHDHLFVDTLFAKLSDHEVRIIIYKCITDEKYFERSEQIGFFNHFFAHSFRNPLHANKFFTAYEFDSGYLVKKN